MYKSFIRLHLDYDDIFDLAFNKSFHDNLEAIEYSASLARTAAIRGTSREKLYQELSFESLQQWFMVSQTVHLLQDIQKSISALSLQVTTPANQLALYKIIKQCTLFSL